VAAAEVGVRMRRAVGRALVRFLSCRILARRLLALLPRSRRIGLAVEILVALAWTTRKSIESARHDNSVH